MTKRIVVLGGTGQQGSATVKALLNIGGDVRVVVGTRRLDSDAAKALQALGAELVHADLDDNMSVHKACAGADGVFGVTQPWRAEYRRMDIPAELRQAEHIIAACKDHGVQHVVFSSVLKTQKGPSGLPHGDSKLAIEERLDAAQLPRTVLRASSFMDNIGQRFFAISRNKLRGFVDGDAKVPYIACRDIGRAVALVFSDPARFIGAEVRLVADFISGDECAAILTELTGRRYRYRAPPALLMRLFAREFFLMRRRFERMGRPPFPMQAILDEATAETRALLPDAWRMRDYLAHKVDSLPQ